MEMVSIKGCSVANCAYNREKQCRTPAITVGPHGECNTFVHASPKAGIPDVKGGVGACQAAGCKFNEALECRAKSVEVATDERHADCQTYDPKAK
jgi:hypothetical protein